MGRKSKKRDRDNYSISSLLAPAPRPYSPVTLSTAASDLRKLQDRRRFSFVPDKHPVDARAKPARVTMKPATRPRQVNLRKPAFNLVEVQAFAKPRQVSLCVRRSQRKQVLFAKKLTGRASRSKRRNAWSNVFCR